jgi:hypothetical protein
LLMAARDTTSIAAVNVSAVDQLIVGFEVSTNCRFWVSTEGLRGPQIRAMLVLSSSAIHVWKDQPRDRGLLPLCHSLMNTTLAGNRYGPTCHATQR